MQTTISNNLSPESRVWVYASNRIFTEQEAANINKALKEYTGQWKAHQMPLAADGSVLFNCFVVLMVDESMAGASGCSIDNSVRFIKNLGSELQVDFFDRLKLYYLDSNNLLNIVSFVQAAELYKNGVIDEHTTVFNHLVHTKATFESSWMIKLSDSPLLKFISTPQPSFNLSL